MEEPGYPGARSALLGAGARILPVPVDAEGLDVAVGARRAGDARLVYVTPSHQYPLGVPMSLARRLALLHWASGARAWVIEDDYDSEFRYGARPVPCLHGLDVDGRVIYVGSFSKTLFPSLRLGFLIVPPDLQEGLVAARAAADQHPPVLDQSILADFLVEGHFARHLRRMRVAYRERLEALSRRRAALLRRRAAAAADAHRPAHDRRPRRGGRHARLARGGAPGRRGRAPVRVLRGPRPVRQRSGPRLRGGAPRSGQTRHGAVGGSHRGRPPSLIGIRRSRRGRRRGAVADLDAHSRTARRRGSHRRDLSISGVSKRLAGSTRNPSDTGLEQEKHHARHSKDHPMFVVR